MTDATRVGRALVTGGAGFVGSHVVDALVARGTSVVVVDNFSTGRERNLERHLGARAVTVVRGDVLDRTLVRDAVRGCDAVFHFQANADVRGGPENTRRDLDQNVVATWNVMEAAHEAGVGVTVFASSATVYGEPDVFPTPESHAPTQTSLYGASKLAGEAVTEAFAEYAGSRCVSLRFTSWIGERYSHGVIADFVRKLRADPSRLAVLGDGSQRKAYLDVADGVAGIFAAIGAGGRKDRFNIGHTATITALDVAGVVVDEMGLRDVAITTGEGPRGWIGDSPRVELDVARVRALGWAPRIPIEEGIRRTVRYLLAHDPETGDD